jgi:hypothetical protein
MNAVHDDFQGCLPRLAAIGGLEDAALWIVGVVVTLSGNVNDVRIRGMHDHLTDVMGSLQSNVGPGCPAVQRLVHAVAMIGAVPQVGFTGAHIDDAVIRRGHGHITDR